MPQGVKPLAQLLIVPRVFTPVGEKDVNSLALPATGPVRSTSVVAVMRRLKLEVRL